MSQPTDASTPEREASPAPAATVGEADRGADPLTTVSRPRSARGGFVGAFVRTVRRDQPRSPMGQIAISALIIVVLAAVVVASGALLRRTDRTTQAANQSSPGPSPSGTAAPSGAPATPTTGASGRSAPPSAPGQPGAPGTASAPAGGANTGGGSNDPQVTEANNVRSSPKPVVTYTGVAGRGCTSPGTTYSEHGWYTNGDAGWWTLANGSYTGNGCNGEFTDMPMSGDANWDQPGQAIVWGFKVGDRPQSCTLSLYVPTSKSPRDVAAKNAHFAVVHGTSINNTTYVNPPGDKFVNQSAHHSSWVTLGTWPVNNGMIGVKLTNRGNPNGYSMTHPHLAGGAVRARCVAV